MSETCLQNQTDRRILGLTWKIEGKCSARRSYRFNQNTIERFNNNQRFLLKQLYKNSAIEWLIYIELIARIGEVSSSTTIKPQVFIL